MELKDAYRLTHNGILALAKAERHGIRIDIKYAKRQSRKLEVKIKEKTIAFETSAFYKNWKHMRGKSLNIDSDDQLAHYLYTYKKIKPMKTTASGGGATDAEALAALDIPELQLLLDLRKMKKLKNTYLSGIIRETVDGVLHPFFNLHLARTFRSSSDSPNIQNMPIRDPMQGKIIRRCFLPTKGNQLAETDFKGIEVGIAACYHKDPTMLEYLHDPSSDMHGDMAAQIFKIKDFDKDDKSHGLLRYATKNGFVFPQFYGDYYGNNAVSLSKWGKLPLQGAWKKDSGVMLSNGLALGDHLRQSGIKDTAAFTKHLKSIEAHFWNERFPVYKEWKESWWKKYNKKGYFDTLTGYRCSGMMGKNNAINYPVQSAAFHCLLWCFIELTRKLEQYKMKSCLVGQVHDSLLTDIYPKELQYVLELIEGTIHELKKTWPWIIVPLETETDLCDVDESWYTKKAMHS